MRLEQPSEVLTLGCLIPGLADPADGPLIGGHTGLAVDEQVGRAGGGALVQTGIDEMADQLGDLGGLDELNLTVLLDLVHAAGELGNARRHGPMLRSTAPARAGEDVSTPCSTLPESPEIPSHLRRSKVSQISFQSDPSGIESETVASTKVLGSDKMKAQKLPSPKQEEKPMPVRKKKSDTTANVHTTSGGRKVSVVLPAELAERVERLADVRGDRLTTTVVRLIEAGERQAHEAIREDALSSLRTELLALVGDLGGQVRREVQAQSHRLSHLLVRTSLESMSARLTAGHVLFKLYAHDQEKAQELYGSTWKQAVERLKNPTPGVRETMNQIVEGAGSQEPAALVSLAAATRQLQQGLGAVAVLAERVEALEGQETGTQASVGELTKQVQTLARSVAVAVAKLEAAEEEARSKPKGFFAR